MKYQKSNFRFGITILEILCARHFRQNGQRGIFGAKFVQKSISEREFQKSESGFRITILETLWAPIFRQNGQVRSFGPKFAQK